MVPRYGALLSWNPSKPLLIPLIFYIWYTKSVFYGMPGEEPILEAHGMDCRVPGHLPQTWQLNHEHHT